MSGSKAGTGRRVFLRRMAGGSTLLLFGACVARNDQPVAGSPYRFLDPLTEAVFLAAARGILYPGKGLPDPARTHFLEDLDAGCAQYDEEVRNQLRLLCAAFEYGTFFDCWPPRRFSRRPPAEAAAVLDRWMKSRIPLRRVAANALKMVTMSYYFAQSGTFGHLHYDGPLLERAEIPYFESFLSLPFDPGPLPKLAEGGER